MVSSLIAIFAAVAGAAAMSFAFPKADLAIAAPVGAIGLFYAWFGLSPKAAFWTGWLAGSVYFALTFAWFGETAGQLIAPFGFFLTLGPGVGDAFFNFALPGALTAYAARRAEPRLVPLAGAAAFAFFEWLRSIGLGPLGVPFANVSYSQVDSPLAPLAAFVGSFGVTFAICILAGYFALLVRLPRSSSAVVSAAVAFLAVIGATSLAWSLWPARTAAPGTQVRVAAIQGNIKQDTKWTKEALLTALDRYTSLSVRAGAYHPAIVVWPETVITTELSAQPALAARFGELAKSLGAELVVGTLQRRDQAEYNALYFFRSDGALDAVYRKRQLVPFAEALPFDALLGWLPVARFVSHFSTGDSSGVVEAGGIRIAPLICWESAFGNLATGDVRDGANALIIATDDAWFGETAGPYQHAQIAQMRAIETGTWILRAASTGISGIINPAGRYTVRSELDVEAVVTGTIGAPALTVYDALGPSAVAFTLALLYLAVIAIGRRRPA